MKTPKTKNSRSRPGKKKVVPLNIRVDGAEKSAFARAAEIAGIPLSAWMRERLRVAALRELDSIGEVAGFVRPNSQECNDE